MIGSRRCKRSAPLIQLNWIQRGARSLLACATGGRPAIRAAESGARRARRRPASLLQGVVGSLGDVSRRALAKRDETRRVRRACGGGAEMNRARERESCAHLAEWIQPGIREPTADQLMASPERSHSRSSRLDGSQAEPSRARRARLTSCL